MGEARELMNQITGALVSQEWDAAAKLYAADAVAVTPDQGEVRGSDNIVAWQKQFFEGSPDATYEPVDEYESGNTAIDEGYFVAFCSSLSCFDRRVVISGPPRDSAEALQLPSRELPRRAS
jgi:ketosteroid isomerase-like protein